MAINPQITFRKAEITDLEGIVKMMADDILGQNREEFRIPLPDSYVHAFREINQDPNNFLVVVDHPSKKIIGTMQLTFIPYLGRKGTKRMQIEAVRVDEKFRGAGIGQQMMEWAIKKAGEEKCGLVQLTTDKTRTDAHRFYKKLGFVDSHLGMKLYL